MTSAVRLRGFLRAGRLVALGLTIAVSPAAGFQDQAPPTFRGGVTFVAVDAYPRRDGRLVEGLTADDFEIFEDGKPQTVASFEFIKVEPNTPDAYRRDPNTKAESDALAADPHNRLLVFYLDLYHTSFSGARDVRGPLFEFLGRTIGPTDLFGVVTPLAPQPVDKLVFARRTDTFEADLARWATDGLLLRDHMSPEEFRLSNCYDASGRIKDLGQRLLRLYREDLTATSLKDLMIFLRDVRDERKNVILITGGWVPQGEQPRLLSAVSQTAMPPIAVGPNGRLGVGVPQLGIDDRNWCNGQISRLAGINFEDRFRDLIALAIRANVTFYPVDVSGVTGNLLRPVGTLRTLAENTHGLAVYETNELTSGFRRIADDLSGYYLLGYASTNPALDGKYRAISVKMKARTISVTARRGYLAPTIETLSAKATAAAAVAVPAAVANEMGKLSLLRSDAELFIYGARAPTGLDIAVEISTQEIARGRWQDGAHVQVEVTRAAGASTEASGHIEAGSRSVIVHVPIRPGEVAPIGFNVRVSSEAGTMDDRAGPAMRARGETEGIDGASALLGAPLTYRGTALARVPLRPVADFQFQRAERLHVEWPVLTTLDQRLARVLDRRGQPLALAATVTEVTRPDRADGAVAGALIAVDLNLAPLTEGDYLIELTAGHSGQTERRLVAFHVVR